MIGLTRHIATLGAGGGGRQCPSAIDDGGHVLLLARKLRGSARATDVVLPLAILNIAQAETLMIGFAMNLVLTSMIAVGLIVPTGLTRDGGGSLMAMGFGLAAVLLPLCGGSGLVMPPLALSWPDTWAGVGGRGRSPGRGPAGSAWACSWPPWASWRCT